MLQIIILAGGSGSRLWPYSRTYYPKQVLKLFQDESLLQKTARRFLSKISAENIHVVTNPNQSHLIQSNLDEINISHQNLIIEEPFARNTAPAICLSALKFDPKDILIVLPSDHIIKNIDKFLETIDEAIELAEKNHLVTLGIKPQYAETGYGYIEAGKKLERGFQVSKFHEKPNKEKAQKYVEKANFFWNSGMFVWKAKTILEEFREFHPQILSNLQKYLKENDVASFFDVESISIDYAILEKSSRVAVIPADIEWSDLGSWKSVFDIQEKDENGNVLNGENYVYNSKNIFVQNASSSRTVAAINIENISIIDTDDAVVVVDLEKTQDVKKIVEKLKESNSEKVEFHKTVYRPWGYFKVLEDTDYFKSKRLVIYPGQSISLQYHKKRSETWTVVKGVASVIRGEEKLELQQGETVQIPMGFIHRLTNQTSINLEIIEVQTGTYFGEDDIIRLEDDYNRK
jgi:mannose-1-phosphate guanylyltransferase/mannose-6-phosphate isomerase